MNKTDEKRIALVVGATGLVGSLVIEKLLKIDKYQKIRVLTRKPLSLLNPRLESIIFDFENPDSTLVWADDVFCCLERPWPKQAQKTHFIRWISRTRSKSLLWLWPMVPNALPS
jgi:uncharacterized protein YbjT (DUF2867 family)